MNAKHFTNAKNKLSKFKARPESSDLAVQSRRQDGRCNTHRLTLALTEMLHLDDLPLPACNRLQLALVTIRHSIRTTDLGGPLVKERQREHTSSEAIGTLTGLEP